MGAISVSPSLVDAKIEASESLPILRQSASVYHGDRHCGCARGQPKEVATMTNRVWFEIQSRRNGLGSFRTGAYGPLDGLD
jgi:hypothetical protein